MSGEFVAAVYDGLGWGGAGGCGVIDGPVVGQNGRWANAQNRAATCCLPAIQPCEALAVLLHLYKHAEGRSSLFWDLHGDVGNAATHRKAVDLEVE